MCATALQATGRRQPRSSRETPTSPPSPASLGPQPDRVEPPRGAVHGQQAARQRLAHPGQQLDGLQGLGQCQCGKDAWRDRVCASARGSSAGHSGLQRWLEQRTVRDDCPRLAGARQPRTHPPSPPAACLSLRAPRPAPPHPRSARSCRQRETPERGSGSRGLRGARRAARSWATHACGGGWAEVGGELAVCSRQVAQRAPNQGQAHRPAHGSRL